MKTLKEVIENNPDFISLLHCLVKDALDAGEYTESNFLTFYTIDKDDRVIPAFIVAGGEFAAYGNPDNLVDIGFTIGEFLKIYEAV